MSLETGAVDHEPVRLARLAREAGEDAVEDAQAAPSDEAVVQGLVRGAGGWRIAPAQAVADDEDDAADHVAVIGSGGRRERAGRTARSAASVRARAGKPWPWRTSAMGYGIHTFRSGPAMRKPHAWAANCAQPSCMVFGAAACSSSSSGGPADVAAAAMVPQTPFGIGQVTRVAQPARL